MDGDGLCQRIVGEILYTVCRQCKGISRRVGEPFIFEYYGFSRYRWNKFRCSDSAFGIFGHFHFLVKCQNDLSIGRSTLKSFGGNCTDQFGRSTIVNQFCSSRDISCSNAGTVVIGRSSVYFWRLVGNPTEINGCLVIGLFRQIEITICPVFGTRHFDLSYGFPCRTVERVFNVVGLVSIVVVHHRGLHFDVGKCAGVYHCLPVCRTYGYVVFPVYTAGTAFITACAGLALVQPTECVTIGIA